MKSSSGLSYLVDVSCIAGALIWVYWEDLPTFPWLVCWQSKVCADNWSCTRCFCFSLASMDFPDCYKLCFCLLGPLLGVLHVNLERDLCGANCICTGFCTCFSVSFSCQYMFHCIAISGMKYHELRGCFFVTLLLRKQQFSNLPWSFSLLKRSVAGFWLL